jgi:hypothetical protein
LVYVLLLRDPLARQSISGGPGAKRRGRNNPETNAQAKIDPQARRTGISALYILCVQLSGNANRRL